MGDFIKVMNHSFIRLRKNKKTLVTIFINPKQFNSKKDFEKYPRNLAKDIKILRKTKIDYLYYPKFKDIFSLKLIIKYTCIRSLSNYVESIDQVILRVF